MGIVDNIKKRMSGAEDEESYDEAYNDDEYYNDSFGAYDDGADADNGMNASTGMGTGMAGLGGGGISISTSSGSALEMKVVKPESFDSVAQIADHLLSKRTVVLNLENTNKETARRLIDFLSGVAYSIDGSLKKIASNAYVITPATLTSETQSLHPAKPPLLSPSSPVRKLQLTTSASIDLKVQH